MAITVEEAKKDPDFAIQGEYVGELGNQDGKETWGLQIIALGEASFTRSHFAADYPAKAGISRTRSKSMAVHPEESRRSREKKKRRPSATASRRSLIRRQVTRRDEEG